MLVLILVLLFTWNVGNTYMNRDQRQNARERIETDVCNDHHKPFIP